MKENVFNKWPSSDYYAQLYSTLYNISARPKGYLANVKHYVISSWIMKWNIATVMINNYSQQNEEPPLTPNH